MLVLRGAAKDELHELVLPKEDAGVGGSEVDANIFEVVAPHVFVGEEIQGGVGIDGVPHF